MANVTAGAHVFLAVDISLLILALMSFLGNGLVLFVIISRPSLRKNESLYLTAGLTLADFLLGILLMPYIVYLIANWREEINYSAEMVTILSTPTVSEIKSCSILTFAIALDRLIAVQWPVFYRRRNKWHYVCGSYFFGFVWAAIDGTLLFLTSDFKPVPGCAAGGCFMSEDFRYYWGVSNMMVNLVSMTITVLLLVKLRTLSANKSTAIAPTERGNTVRIAELNKFKNANIIAVNVLLVSSVCIFIPNCCAGLGEMFGLTFYRKLGPFVSFGLVLSGVFNSIIYGMKHKDIRVAISGLMSKSQNQKMTATN